MMIFTKRGLLDLILGMFLGIVLLVILTILARGYLLDDPNLSCPSGKIIHSDPTLALYKVVVLSSGEIVITEHADNHDTDKMKHTNVPYERYCLYQSRDDGNGIKLGYWIDRSMDFEKIVQANVYKDLDRQ